MRSFGYLVLFLLLASPAQAGLKAVATNGGSGGSTVTGTGTTNYVAKWTSSTSIGTGTLYDDGVGNVGLGTTVPTANLTVIGSQTINAAVNAQALSLVGNIDTITTKVLNITETWNNAATIFNAPIFENITNTASNGASNIIELQVGGVERFSVRQDGIGIFSNSMITGSAGVPTSTTNGTGFTTVSTGGFKFTSGNTTNFATDTFITRGAAATVQLGAANVASTPVAQTLQVQNVVAGTSNISGSNFTINGSVGTGTGIGGDIIFRTAPAGTTGTAQNALIEALRIANTGFIGIGTATPVATLDIFGGSLSLSKLASAPASAPGAGRCLFFTVAGTNAGSAKYQAMCGTSTTPVTIVDNIGAGF